MSQTYIPPAPPVSAPKKQRHIVLWVILGIVALAAIGSLNTDKGAVVGTQDGGPVVETTEFTASNGYSLTTSDVAAADVSWMAQPASDRATACRILVDEDPDSPLFQVGVQSFANGSGWSMSKSQAVVEYVVATYC